MRHASREGPATFMSATTTERRVPLRKGSTRIRRMLDVLMLVIAIGAPLWWVRANFEVYDQPGNLMDPFTDATSYLAAGERLNAGHDLYRLQPGDRPVLVIPSLFTAALLSPPPIAVVWRPLAALPFGWQLWIAATWIALLGTIVFLVVRIGPRMVLLVFLLSHAIGEQLAVANANAFIPAMYVLLWIHRDRGWIGALVATAAAVKLAPIALAGWLAGRRNLRAIGVGIGTFGVIGLVSLLGAGIESFVDYLRVVPSNNPTPLSLSGWTGIGPASYVFLASATVASAATGDRWPRLSFGLGVLGAVLGTPALYASGLVGLLALAAPFLPERRAARADEPVSADPGAAVATGPA